MLEEGEAPMKPSTIAFWIFTWPVSVPVYLAIRLMDRRVNQAMERRYEGRWP